MARDMLSYCAGLFDADGCFTMYHSTNIISGKEYTYVTPTAAVEIREEVIADIFLEMFGGSKRHKVRRKAIHSDTYSWKVSATALHNFVGLIEPYLILKKDQANLIKEFRELRPRNTTRKISECERDKIEDCLARMRVLNKCGVGKSGKSLFASDYVQHRKTIDGENKEG